eukprot:UN18110
MGLKSVWFCFVGLSNPCVHFTIFPIFMWNELPYSLRAANSVPTFKSLLKTFYLKVILIYNAN